MSVVVEDLVKKFGNQFAVDHISFRANPGEILGFLGPNGAGKSTTMKIATCFLPPSAGRVSVSGFDVTENPMKVKKLVGYLPEQNPLYDEMFIREYLGFISSIHGINGKLRTEKIKEIIQLTGLEKEQHKKISQLSKGYRQRVGLAQSMIHDPEVLILDEPTSGLDPNQIVEIRSLISRLSKNKTVILSTHIMQEVQAICDRVVIIDNGKIVADDRVENLVKKQPDRQVISAEFEHEIDEAVFREIPGIIEIRKDKNSIRFHVEKETDLRASIFKLAAEKNLPLIGLNKIEESLENIFQRLTGKKSTEKEE